jgi:mono/diheme cytochrome c family protein
MTNGLARFASIALLCAAGAIAAPDTTALDRVPPKARLRPNPFQGNPAAAAAGVKLFEQHCAGCHATGAKGRFRGPALDSVQVRQAPPGALFWVITNGVVRRGMPPWSKLPEPERWQIVTFLTRGSKPPPAPQPGR